MKSLSTSSRSIPTPCFSPVNSGSRSPVNSRAVSLVIYPRISPSFRRKIHAMPHPLYINKPHLRSRALEKSRSDAHYAPVDKLPVEILGEIFTYCVINHLSYSSYEYPVPGETEPPMTLSWVSRHWRMVALSDPLLWSSLVIPSQFKCNVAPAMSIVELWIERSASVPLYFHLQRSHRNSSCKCNRAAHTLDFLIRHVQSWKSITLEMEELSAQRFINLNQTSVPALESLEIRTQSNYCTDSTTERIIATISSSSFPNLRRFSWQYLGTSPALDTIPWSQLSKISLNNRMSIQECLRYLAQCSQAISIELENVAPSAQDLLSSSGPTILPNLQQLTLKAYSYSMHLLKQLMTPKLNTLFLDEGWGQRKGFDALPEFLSLCSVNTLTIVQQYIHIEDIIDILKSAALQRVSYLKVSSESVAPDENQLRNSDTLDKAISSRLVFEEDDWGRLFVGWNNL
ncbi:hypothetical protein BDQ12DRAFT_669293 [Crucibulum laeve]|uniref:Uncharacterized protein n=1 Tax=Crucibulum laeve TaxID=68775 RepID=A0A5C3LMY2_9AGAR|nr:hypothetical protein BDQ12DRAFT_669293 [Crucibulum laeve]